MTCDPDAKLFFSYQSYQILSKDYVYFHSNMIDLRASQF